MNKPYKTKISGQLRMMHTRVTVDAVHTAALYIQTHAARLLVHYVDDCQTLRVVRYANS
jgi:hypothetical protein